MAGRCFPISAFMLLLLPLFCQAIVNLTDGKPNPFQYIEHLQGHHRGEIVEGLHDLKQYLKKLGYLDSYQQSNKTNIDDDFDDLLESAVKTYQLNYHLNTTALLDAETVKKMMTPRCGVPDNINGTMQSGNEDHHGSSTVHTVSRYSFLRELPKWPDSKKHLTYAFLPGAPTNVMRPVCALAFGKWSSVTHFTFQEIQDINSADITIGFYSGDHGDGDPFNGPGGTLAHATGPTHGRLHFNADQNWAVVPTPGAYDLETTTMHEIGHLLGLDHSTVEDALMYPTGLPGVKKGLHDDDIQGIRALYTSTPSSLPNSFVSKINPLGFYFVLFVSLFSM